MTDLEQDFLIERAKCRDLEDRLIRAESRGRWLLEDNRKLRVCLEEISKLASDFTEKGVQAAQEGLRLSLCVDKLAGEALELTDKWGLNDGKRRKEQGAV